MARFDTTELSLFISVNNLCTSKFSLFFVHEKKDDVQYFEIDKFLLFHLDGSYYRAVSNTKDYPIKVQLIHY